MKMFQNRSGAVAFLATLFAAASAFGVDGQTDRRQVLPAPTPPPAEVPMIISLADQTPSDSQITGAAENVRTETAEEKLERYSKRIKELSARVKTLEAAERDETDGGQKRLLLSLDILTRAEQRAEALRKQLFELVEKENSVKTRLEQLAVDLRPEMIERAAAVAGSLRPEDVRDARRKALEAEKSNLENLLAQLEASRVTLEERVQKSDLMVEKIRAKFEKEIDAALSDAADVDNR